MHRVHFYDQCKLHFGQGLDDDLRKITKVIRIYSLQMLLKGISFTCILEWPFQRSFFLIRTLSNLNDNQEGPMDIEYVIYRCPFVE